MLHTVLSPLLVIVLGHEEINLFQFTYADVLISSLRRLEVNQKKSFWSLLSRGGYHT